MVNSTWDTAHRIRRDCVEDSRFETRTRDRLCSVDREHLPSYIDLNLYGTCKGHISD